MNSPFELPKERLATTTETGERNYLYPAFVKGKFRTIRTFVYSVLLIVFLILPWINIHGKQAILLDIPNRQFAIFGLTFWAHEAPILFLVFITFTLTILLVTTLFGRVWCGWACPQTVFIDIVFRRIENFFEGRGLAQKRFNQSPFTFKKGLIKFGKWSIFLLVSLVISHSFLAYFVGADHLLGLLEHTPHENWSAFITMSIATAIVLFDFAWFREQFCIIACPYGRLQSVILDEDSTIVSYDKKRTDCINCYRCVQVCPTGIDIRRGTQMECIMCTACIDACDEVMKKSGLPKKLIRLSSENKNEEKKSRIIRPRVILYVMLLLLSSTTLGYVVSHRNMTPVHVKKQSNPPYIVLSNGMIRNQVTLIVRNQYFHPITLYIDTQNVPKNIKIVMPVQNMLIHPGTQGSSILFIDFPKEVTKEGSAKMNLIKKITVQKKIIEETIGVSLSGPLS